MSDATIPTSGPFGPSAASGAPGRAVLVTGASRGIGRAIASAFAANGDRGAVHHRTSPEAAEALRGIHVLVNNAGVWVEHPPVESSYEEWRAAWRHTLEVNLIGAANVTWCAVRHMLAGGRGRRIVNVSSRGAFRGEPRHPAYGASKPGLNSFGQSMARALAPHGIAVATVAPGFVETEMAEPDLRGPDGDAIRAQSPFGRVARPEEVAAAVLFLASPQAEFASGAILDLNGASYVRS